MHVTTARQKTGTTVFCRTFTNFCRGVHKLLPWHSQTFATAFTNFCHGVEKLLPRHSQTFEVVTDLYFDWFKKKFAYLKLLKVTKLKLMLTLFFNYAV